MRVQREHDKVGAPDERGVGVRRPCPNDALGKGVANGFRVAVDRVDAVPGGGQCAGVRATHEPQPDDQYLGVAIKHFPVSSPF